MNLRSGSLLLLLILAMTTSLPADDFLPGKFVSPEGKSLPYRLLFPLGYDESKPKTYPLVLFLHGSGERGDDNQAQLKNVVAHFETRENRARFRCFVLAPQCPNGQKWVDTDWGAEFNPRPMNPSDAMTLALGCLDAVAGHYHVDPTRLYVCGISMGGYGVWDCLTRYPERFAAGVAVCGGGDPATVTAAAAKVPVWAFHSADDPNVHVTKSRRMIEAWKAQGGQPRYTEYNGLGHVSWEKAFGEPGLMPWLFAQHLGQP